MDYAVRMTLFVHFGGIIHSAVSGASTRRPIDMRAKVLGFGILGLGAWGLGLWGGALGLRLKL